MQASLEGTEKAQIEALTFVPSGNFVEISDCALHKPEDHTMVDMSPHVSTMFKELFDELKSMKQQQWTITNYGALMLAAIYGVRHQFPAEVTHLQWKLKFLASLAIATAILGSSLLVVIQWNMRRSRRRLDKLHKTYFTQAELEGIGLSDSQIRNLGNEKWWCYFLRGWEFLVALILVLWAGAVLAALAVWWPA